MGCSKLWETLKTIAIVCYQWGDTGKGKIVDLLAERADIIARGTGGDNAGHTVIINGKKYIFHLIPSGILWDCKGKINLIGSGVVFNPRVAREELDILAKENMSFNNLIISRNAKLILPQHILLDKLKESADGKGKIGTTGRGIGPAYVDHYARLGLTVNDMLNKDVFVKKLRKNLKEKFRMLEHFDINAIRQITAWDPHLERGAFFDHNEFLNVDNIVSRYSEYGEYFKEMIRDTDDFLRQNIGKSRTLLEGAQGLFLSVDFGTYPYVTASDCSSQGLARGVGIKDSDIDMTLGIVKAFYMTRVGGGPFPTEIGGKDSADWCGQDGITRETEKNKFPEASVNSQDEMEQGVGIRMAGDEYGATTGRPRRTGWLDLPMLRYAINLSGPNIVFTKIDVLKDCEEIKICHEYIYRGPDYWLGRMKLTSGDHISTAVPDSEVMKYCEPKYVVFPGWKSDIREIKSNADLPEKLGNIIEFVKNETGAEPRIISVGADRNETIFL
jgi:adenylosuccinate synthase